MPSACLALMELNANVDLDAPEIQIQAAKVHTTPHVYINNQISTAHPSNWLTNNLHILFVYVIVDINECTSLLPVDPNGPCGATAICVNILGSYKCECPAGSDGDPYTSGCYGLARCEKDADCPDDTSCDQNAGACIDSCSSAHCGPNTDCLSRGHTAACLCKAGYVGDPNDLVNGCISRKRLIFLATTRKHSHFFLLCLFFTACSDVWCADNAQCIVSSLNQGVCRCIDGFFGNPWSGGGCSPDYSCSPTRPCVEGQECINGICLEKCNSSQCGVGARCDPHTHRCQCLPFFIGDPDALCVPRKSNFSFLSYR